MIKKNILHQKFNKLLVIAPVDSIKGKSAWLCRCECGVEKIVKSENLLSGQTKSCGCWNNESRSLRSKKMYQTRQKYFEPKLASAARIWKKRYSDGDLTLNDFYQLSQNPCYYCDEIPKNLANAAKEDPKSSSQAKSLGDFRYNGLDRVDNNLPHNLNNVVPCCKYCNFAKRERSQLEFAEWIKRLVRKLNG